MKSSQHANVLNQLAIFAIRVYQKTASPILRKQGRRCLHFPTCSEYGILAFQSRCFFRAILLTWRRFQDCNPFSGRPYVDFPP